MKNLYFLILLFFSTSSLYSQGLNFATPNEDYAFSSNIFDTLLVSQTWDAALAPDALNSYVISLIPTEGEPLDEIFRMVVVENTIPVEWYYSLCNLETCFLQNTWPDYETVVDEDDIAFDIAGYDVWDLKMYPNNHPDTAKVKVYIYKNGENDIVADSLDLTFRYSDTSTATAELNLEEEINVNVFPNPASDQLNLDFNLGSEMDLSISIIDVAGNKVSNVTSGIFRNGSNNLTTDVSTLDSGLYFLSISSKESTTSRRFSIIK